MCCCWFEKWTLGSQAWKMVDKRDTHEWRMDIHRAEDSSRALLFPSSCYDINRIQRRPNVFLGFICFLLTVIFTVVYFSIHIVGQDSVLRHIITDCSSFLETSKWGSWVGGIKLIWVLSRLWLNILRLHCTIITTSKLHCTVITISKLHCTVITISKLHCTVITISKFVHYISRYFNKTNLRHITKLWHTVWWSKSLQR